MAANKEFYIGYLPKLPDGIGKRVKSTIFLVLLLVTIIPVIAAVSQRPVDRGTFEFGTVRTFEGVIYETPIPTLRMIQKDKNGKDVIANIILVGFGKFGIPEYARGNHGNKVQLDGTLIYRDNMTMIELVDDENTFKVLGTPKKSEIRSKIQDLGSATISGELVDTKCFFGVMRPATGKVHRACAIRCLSGGVPPGILIRYGDEEGTVVMLAGKDNQVLEYDVQWAALQVKATGQLQIEDGVPILRVENIERIVPDEES